MAIVRRLCVLQNYLKLNLKIPLNSYDLFGNLLNYSKNVCLFYQKQHLEVVKK
jgi:hypothetical protein